MATIAKAWNMEAFAAAMMPPRYHTDIAVKRSLGAKLER